MSHNEQLQVIGTIFIALTGAVILYVVADHQRWCTYGRWIAGVIGAAQFAFVGSRILYLTGVTGPETTIFSAGMVAATVFTIELNLVVMHIRWHKLGLAEASQHRRNHEQART